MTEHDPVCLLLTAVVLQARADAAATRGNSTMQKCCTEELDWVRRDAGRFLAEVQARVDCPGDAAEAVMEVVMLRRLAGPMDILADAAELPPKLCTRCRVEQGIEQFNMVNSRGKWQTDSWCRNCRVIDGRERRHRRAAQQVERFLVRVGGTA